MPQKTILFLWALSCCVVRLRHPSAAPAPLLGTALGRSAQHAQVLACHLQTIPGTGVLSAGAVVVSAAAVILDENSAGGGQRLWDCDCWPYV